MGVSRLKCVTQHGVSRLNLTERLTVWNVSRCREDYQRDSRNHRHGYSQSAEEPMVITRVRVLEPQLTLGVGGSCAQFMTVGEDGEGARRAIRILSRRTARPVTRTASVTDSKTMIPRSAIPKTFTMSKLDRVMF